MRLIVMGTLLAVCPAVFAGTKESDGNQKTPYIQNLKFSKMASFNPSMIDPGSPLSSGPGMQNPFGDKSVPGGQPGQPSKRSVDAVLRLRRHTNSGHHSHHTRNVPQQSAADLQITKNQILTVLADIIQKQKEVARDTAEVIEVLKQIGISGPEGEMIGLKDASIPQTAEGSLIKDQRDADKPSPVNRHHHQPYHQQLPNDSQKPVFSISESSSSDAPTKDTFVSSSKSKQEGKEHLRAFLRQQLGKYNNRDEIKQGDQIQEKDVKSEQQSAGAQELNGLAGLTDRRQAAEHGRMSDVEIKKLEAMQKMIAAVQA
jgi:hypothetical protein